MPNITLTYSLRQAFVGEIDKFSRGARLIFKRCTQHPAPFCYASHGRGSVWYIKEVNDGLYTVQATETKTLFDSPRKLTRSELECHFEPTSKPL